MEKPALAKNDDLLIKFSEPDNSLFVPLRFSIVK